MIFISSLHGEFFFGKVWIFYRKKIFEHAILEQQNQNMRRYAFVKSKYEKVWICQIIYTSQMAENNHNFAKHKHVRIGNLFR